MTGHLPALTSPHGLRPITATARPETSAILPSCETWVKNGSKSFLWSGQRASRTTRLLTFKTSSREISPGL